MGIRRAQHTLNVWGGIWLRNTSDMVQNSVEVAHRVLRVGEREHVEDKLEVLKTGIAQQDHKIGPRSIGQDQSAGDTNGYRDVEHPVTCRIAQLAPGPMRMTYATGQER